MDIFEFAMKMEEDGRAYYLEHASKTDNPALKKVLTELADDELKHYNIFRALKNNAKAEYKDSEKTKIIDTAKNVFQALKDKNEDYTFESDFTDIWKHALEIEKKSENFYREKAGEVDTDNKKRILNRIADEEHNHWVTIENVIQFLKRPQRWLEDAEWNHMEPY